VLLGGLYVALNVFGNYRGNVSGLFYTGRNVPLPRDVARHTWRVNDAKGYDAQYYHLIAHDPLLRRDTLNYLDNPRLRWRRIGVPGLAALAPGSEDYAYLAIQLGCLFLGAWWLALYADSVRRSVVWGLGFLLVPAVLVSLDRMTVDLPLTAACVGFVWYGTQSRPSGWVYGILAAAPLIRETGIVLVIAWCLYQALRRNWVAGLAGLACAGPVIGWWVYVGSRAPADATVWLARYPFSGLIDRTIAGEATNLASPWLRAAAAAEILAMAGIWLALLCTAYLVLRRVWGPAEIAAVGFAAFASLLGKPDIWDSAYAIGRTLSPLLIVLMLIGLRDRQMVLALPIVLVLSRILLQYEAQIVPAARNLLGR
jgi:hypothetical protein